MDQVSSHMRVPTNNNIQFLGRLSGTTRILRWGAGVDNLLHRKGLTMYEISCRLILDISIDLLTNYDFIRYIL